MTIQISSSAFENGGEIPKKYSCDHDDVSPPLEWSGIPVNTKSLALIMDDPDAPAGTWVHWVLYNIPPSLDNIPEAVQVTPEVVGIGLQGKNDFRKIGYGGPCPPFGRSHRYFFKLFALDALLDLRSGISKNELLDGMQGHILGEGELIGLYSRS